MNEAEDIYGELREVKRRLEALETAPRVPQITTYLSGIQAATHANLDLTNMISDEWLAIPGTELTLHVSDVGRVLMFFEAQMYVGTFGTDDTDAFISVEFDGPEHREASDSWALWGYEMYLNLGRRSRTMLFEGLPAGEYTVRLMARHYSVIKPSFVLLDPVTVVLLPL